MIKLGIISDTHGQYELTREAIKICQELNVDQIIHCGDIGGSEIIRILSVFPVNYVYGNCDSGLKMTYADIIQTCGGILHQQFGSLTLENKRIAFFHLPDSNDCLRREIATGRWDLICYGHTHRHFLEQYSVPSEADPNKLKNILVLNPGAFDQRWEPAGFCIVTLPDMEVTRIPL